MKAHLEQYPLIKTDKPFTGSVESTVTYNADENTYYVDYSGQLHNDSNGNLSFDEYQAKVDANVKIVSWDDVDLLVKEFEQTLITKPEPITAERFNDMLEVLPPCRWHNCGGFEVFHISERLTGNLVSWFAHTDNKYFEFVDNASVKDEYLRAKLNAAMGAICQN